MKNSSGNSLLDLLLASVGCDYLSDLKYEPNNSAAAKCLEEMNKNAYSQDEIDEVKIYLDIK